MLVQLLQRAVLRREAAFRRHVHDQHNLAPVLRERVRLLFAWKDGINLGWWGFFLGGGTRKRTVENGEVVDCLCA